MTLCELRKKLSKAGVTETAALSGLSTKTVQRVRDGATAPNMATFERLCKAVAGRRSKPKALKSA